MNQNNASSLRTFLERFPRDQLIDTILLCDPLARWMCSQYDFRLPASPCQRDTTPSSADPPVPGFQDGQAPTSTGDEAVHRLPRVPLFYLPSQDNLTADHEFDNKSRQLRYRYACEKSLPAIPSSNPPFTEDEHFVQVGTLERSSSTNCECHFSLVPKEDARSPSEALKSPTKRRRLMSLVSSREKEQMGNKSEGPPPHPSTSSYSTYPADATFNLHLTSDGFGVDNEGPPYNPHYGKSSPDLSTLSKKKRSLVSLDYGGGLFRKLTKTLVISGVKEHEVYKYNAVKQWCESFGEVRSMSRKVNGDIHVDFCKSSVADTVCRVRGNVVLNGTSVYLSWFCRKKVVCF